MKRKPIYKRTVFWKWAGIVIIGMALLGAVLPEPPTSESADKSSVNSEPTSAVAAKSPDISEKSKTPVNAPQTAKKQQVEKAPATPQEVIEAEVSAERIRNIEVIDGWLNVELSLGDVITPEWHYEETLELTELINELGFDSDGVLFRYVDGVTDVYGNSSDAQILKVGYSTETIAKINFENMEVKNVVAIADEFERMASFK